MKTLIIQTSPMHTASTVLVNALYGMIPELSNMNAIGTWDCWDIQELNGDTFEVSIELETPNDFQNIIVLKSHDVFLDYFMAKYGNSYNVYFISSERKGKNSPEYMIPDKYRNYGNLVIFDFEEINATKDYSVEDIGDCIYNKVSSLITEIDFDKIGGVRRIKEMNKRYQEIKDMPFDYVDEFYHIHGSHRNRIHHTPTNPYQFKSDCSNCGYNFPSKGESKLLCPACEL